MRTTTAIIVMGAVLTACSSSDTGNASSSSGGGGCADISGNYNVTESVTESDCPNQQGAKSTNSFTIAKDASGYTVVLPGVEGGCPGTLDASCRFQAQCVVKDKTGATSLTYNADWTFSGKTFTGSMVGAAAAGVIGPKACSITETDDGTRL